LSAGRGSDAHRAAEGSDDLRAATNALLSKLHTGYQWLLVPSDFSPRSTLSIHLNMLYGRSNVAFK
jgi:transposase